MREVCSTAITDEFENNENDARMKKQRSPGPYSDRKAMFFSLGERVSNSSDK